MQASYILERAAERKTIYDLYSNILNGIKIFMQVIRGWLLPPKEIIK